MKLSSNMNFIDFGKFIMKKKSEGKSKEEIGQAFKDAYNWTDSQVAHCLMPYYK